MAFTGTFCDEAEIEAKEGANVSASVTEAMHNYWVAEIEAYVNNLCRYDFKTNYSSLSANVKQLLNLIASNYCAIMGISYDMSGYTSRIEAENMINILMYNMNSAMDLIKDQKTVTYMDGA